MPTIVTLNEQSYNLTKLGTHLSACPSISIDGSVSFTIADDAAGNGVPVVTKQGDRYVVLQGKDRTHPLPFTAKLVSAYLLKRCKAA